MSAMSKKHLAPHLFIILGATSDLMRRKLLPALFVLQSRLEMAKNCYVLGISRSQDLTDATFREWAHQALTEAGLLQAGECASWCQENFFYHSLREGTKSDFQGLAARLQTLEAELGLPGNRAFYLALPPGAIADVIKGLGQAGLHKSPGWARVVVEKPFGRDLASAQKLNRLIHRYFKESQLYRIDHYLGKETVQNMLVTRFGNSIFEPLWNHNYISRVEITSAESLGVEGRGGYYDSSGALRDMVQNHLLQLVGFIAMEPPGVMEADAIRNETLKVFQALRPIRENQVERHVIRGQYIASTIKGAKVPGYRDETGVPSYSRTETYAAMRFYIDNWRWAGVPFYIRTGKRLPTRVTEVVVHFRQVPHHLFNSFPGYEPVNNQLIIRIQPDEGILMKIGLKIPGAGFHIQTVNMDFHYSKLGDKHLPSAYERLLLDCMQGDATLYTRGDAVEEAWRFIQPVLNAWEANPDIPVYGYPAGSWGPDIADELIYNGQWRYPCKNLTDDGSFCEL